MKTLAITKTVHPQSKKEVTAIKVLGSTFIYSDKRGVDRYAMISQEFAKEVISAFPVKVGRGNILEPGKEIYFPERMKNSEVRLSWNFFGKGEYELLIHDGSDHVWTSNTININE